MFPEIEKQLEVIERGAVDIFSREELIRKLEKSRAENRPLRVKAGFDPTAPDMHLGHAVPLGKMRDFQDLGHQLVIIIGDYTARVGDPSGQNKTRPELDTAAIDAAAASYFNQVGKVIDTARVEIVRNGDWFSTMRFEDVINLTSKMTIAQLLERDDFSKRYKAGNPIALHELLYPMMQGYDSVMVRADIEIGATEQTFNLLVGRELQRDAGMAPQVAITLPMLVGTDGVKKMSKSLGNYIGVTEPPETMYGKAMSISDDVTRDYFVLTTKLPLAEIDEILAQGNPMAAKLRLASEIVKRYHDEPSARAAEEHFNRTVRRKETPDEIPEVEVPQSLCTDGKVWIVKLLVHCGLSSSNREARRLIVQGGVSLNGETVTDAGLDLEIEDGTLLKAGKRKYARIRIG